MKTFSIDPTRLAQFQRASAMAMGAAQKAERDLNRATDRHQSCLEALRTISKGLPTQAGRIAREKLRPETLHQLEQAEANLATAEAALNRARRELAAVTDIRNNTTGIAARVQHYMQGGRS
ncbi:hypothetical protein AA309_26585 [Microvirga vignae]|uniref:Uncharacterized protein n=1 Tax=Microvirga vignae TaxID=1225564 RepID=A0A0H1R699_9HYPH|nr:hypothetical protein [Microvirga vignae]KLK90301.1 hypothetical protein AA309_26585 [Microvirga vignae]